MVTADICKEETLEVVERKFDDLSSKSLAKVLEEVGLALIDIDIVEEYEGKMEEAKRYIQGKNDRKVLAAVLKVEPDYFITGDGDFHEKEIEEKVDMIKSRELLEKIR